MANVLYLTTPKGQQYPATLISLPVVIPQDNTVLSTEYDTITLVYMASCATPVIYVCCLRCITCVEHVYYTCIYYTCIIPIFLHIYVCCLRCITCVEHVYYTCIYYTCIIPVFLHIYVCCLRYITCVEHVYYTCIIPVFLHICVLFEVYYMCRTCVLHMYLLHMHLLYMYYTCIPTHLLHR